jgi:hypothetical protein
MDISQVRGGCLAAPFGAVLPCVILLAQASESG